ncbi:MAG: lactate utilization protein [Acidimicrobiia bacterium]|nr:lactate utilization protein [Acidimicrobiia bacterium]
MERDRFLARVRAAQRGAGLPDVSGPQAAPPIEFADPVARFVSAADDAGAQVVPVERPETALRAIPRIAATERAGPQAGYLAWDGLDPIVPGLYDIMAEQGWERIDAAVGRDTRASDHQRVERAAIGITSADVAIAATGSVVLQHGPGRPRSASLLVEHHIVVLRTDAIVPALHHALARADWDRSSNLVVITGPSRTGDIESILTLGVHGPRYLSVVLIG